ncbi:MAG: stage 0 sporulation protein J [Chloroflexi bacterium HGW-Chloroflexi-8]|nr:MAG: stage 0 sporulation protein J [Chloroflexi bacterium HGW-Chloroflexi-8]
MVKRTGLGKGLEALIPVNISGIQSISLSSVLEIPVNEILPNPHQPRTEMNPDELQDLAESIREHGIIQPLIISPGNKENEYFLIAGERRLRAAKIVGLKQVPAILRNVSDQGQLELALIENVQRTDLSPLETAEAYRQLSDDFNLSHEEIAKRVGKSRVTITNSIRLLKLPDSVRNALASGIISEGHARALLALTSPQAQLAVLETILKFDYSVRQTEELVRKYGGERSKKSEKAPIEPEISALEERIRNQIGMRVNLDHHGNKGKIIIHYYSNEELNQFIDRFFME